ncbi:hypothetical protein G9F71_008615 [Clostridium sp. FP2]|nr:hypothetical protein [Clostridium sp. FP2]MBZ9622915.1 hypothetical protein [Clostridium sp. FP2]
MDLSKYTFWQLIKLYNQIGIEFLKRTWWIWIIILATAIIVIIYKNRQK